MDVLVAIITGNLHEAALFQFPNMHEYEIVMIINLYLFLTECLRIDSVMHTGNTCFNHELFTQMHGVKIISTIRPAWTFPEDMDMNN